MFLSVATSSAATFFNLVPLVVFLPVAGLLINIIFGGRMGQKAIGAVASAASGLAFVVAILQALALVGQPAGTTITLAEWIKIGDLQTNWAFKVDTLSTTMMLVVAGVGTLIHIYAIGYMHEDVQLNGDPGRFRRFFVYMNLFIAAMMTLVTGSSFLMLFVGWEGVGLCSYLLIGFWYEKGKDGIGNALAAKKAFVANRIGDFGLLIAMFLIFWNFHSLNFDQVFSQAATIAQSQPHLILAITLFMLLGVAGKSAQLPLYVWLPDAMAGPTPVSALIHAATMVTAGVYLVSRSFALYSTVPQAQTIVATVGGLTALFAATIAVGQFDIKKVLAYSTISQLGFMVAAVGMGAFVAGMFHLVTHAFFKALLFLSAGSVIQGVEAGLHHVEHDPYLKKQLKTEHAYTQNHHYDPQDMRNMGGLLDRMKVTFVVYLIGALALAGIFPLAGFWSKDEILAEAFKLHPAVYWMLTIAAFFTAFYMGRQVLLVFFGRPRTAAAEHAEENPPVMTVPLMVLAVLAVFGGLLNVPGATFFKWLEHTITIAKEGEFNYFVAILSTVLALLALLLAWYLYSKRYRDMQDLPVAKRSDDPLRAIIGPIFTVFENKYWVDEAYKAVFLDTYVWLAKFLAQVIDGRFWHDWFHDVVLVGGYRLLSRLLAVRIDLGGIDFIANGLAAVAQGLAARLRRLQTGLVRNYALAVFLGVVVIFGYLIIRVFFS